jgi:hypothetical protein
VVVKVKDLETILILEVLEDLEVVAEEETELQQEDRLFLEDVEMLLQQTHHKVTMVEMVIELALQMLEVAAVDQEQLDLTLQQILVVQVVLDHPMLF